MNIAESVDQVSRRGVALAVLLTFAGCLPPAPVPTGGAPSISVQPADLGVLAGASASFSVTAAGDAPLAYQWKRGSSVIAGATASTYTLAATTLADSAATFSVLVTNTVGSVLSREAVLTVSPSGMPGTLTVETIDRAGHLADHFFAYQDGDGAWQAHVAQATGHHEITITDPRGRYGLAYADGDTPPRMPGYGSTSPGLDFSGAIVHATLAEAATLTVPLGQPPGELRQYFETAVVSTGSDRVQLRLPGDVKDFEINGPSQHYQSKGKQLLVGKTYTGYAELITLTNSSVFLLTSQIVAGLANSVLDFGSFDYSAPGGPGSGGGSSPTNHVLIQGAAPGAMLQVDFGFAVPQGNGYEEVINRALRVLQAADATGAISVPVKHPDVSATNFSGPYFVVVSAFDFAHGTQVDARVILKGNDDAVVTLPPAFNWSSATVTTLAPYPRIQQPFTTQGAGSVYVVELGSGPKLWTALASTGWYGGAGKPVTWTFPDLSKVAGWSDAAWKSWATGTMGVFLTAVSGLDLQTAIDHQLIIDLPAVPGEMVVEVANDGSDVTLP